MRGGTLAISKSDPRSGKGHQPVTSNLVGGHVRRGEKKKPYPRYGGSRLGKSRFVWVGVNLFFYFHNTTRSSGERPAHALAAEFETGVPFTGVLGGCGFDDKKPLPPDGETHGLDWTGPDSPFKTGGWDRFLIICS